MSQENVEIVRRIYDAVARRDVVTPFEYYAEDIVWDVSNWRVAGMGLKPVYRGHEGVRECWREIVSVFGEVDFEVEKLTDAGDQVLAVIREREIGRASGAPVESTHLAVWTLADGKVTRMQIFDDHQQAFEAAGLSEQEAHAPTSDAAERERPARS
jgi:ketosteroid isomerase-like protein